MRDFSRIHAFYIKGKQIIRRDYGLFLTENVCLLNQFKVCDQRRVLFWSNSTTELEKSVLTNNTYKFALTPYSLVLTFCLYNFAAWWEGEPRRAVLAMCT